MEFYFHNALAQSTQRSYSSSKKRYFQFCTQFNLSVLPLSEHQLCQYISFLAKEGVSHASIKCYLSALRHLQISHNLPDPMISSMPKLETVVKGIKVQQSKKPDNGKVRLPITPTVLLKIRAVWERQREDFNHIMLWAACCTCFFGFMPAGEMTIPSQIGFDPSVHLTFEDVSVDNICKPSMLCLRLKASKTDPFRKGVNIVLGRTYNNLCPIEALLAYLAVRGNGTGFLFRFGDGRLLTKSLFVSKVRDALSRAGLVSKDYAGHSFRIGAATTAAECGLNEYMIKMLGRWQSSAYERYIQTPRENLANISVVLSSGGSNPQSTVT